MLLGDAAQATKLLHCGITSGPFVTGCQVMDQELAAPTDYLVEYTVDYVYHCRGNGIAVGLQTEVGAAWLVRAADPQRLVLQGSRFLRPFCAQPQRAYSAYVLPDCQVAVLQVSAAPAQATLRAWHDEAQLRATTVQAALDAWLLATHVACVIQWDDNQLLALQRPVRALLEMHLAHVGLGWQDVVDAGGAWRSSADMPDAWRTLLQTTPDVIQLSMLLDYLQAVSGARPPTYAPVSMGAPAVATPHAVADYFRGRLLRELQSAQRLLARLREARVHDESSLTQVIADIDTQMTP